MFFRTPTSLYRVCSYLIASLVLLYLSADGLRSCLPDGDLALHVQHLRDFLDGRRLLGAYSRFRFAHPGPFLYLTQAPGVLIPAGPLVQVQILQFLWQLIILGLAIEALRILSGKWSTGVLVALGYLICIHYFSPIALFDVWGPIALLPWFFLFLVVSAGVLRGRVQWLPAQWGLAAGITQIHLGTLPSCGLIVLLSLVPALWSRLERLWPRLAQSALTVFVLYVPAIVEATIQPRAGNLGRILRRVLFRSEAGESEAIWSVLAEGAVNQAAVLVLALGAVAAALLLAMRRERSAEAMVLFAGYAGLGLSVLRTPGELHLYLYAYGAVLAGFSAGLVGEMLIEGVCSRRVLSPSIVVSLLIGMLLYFLAGVFPYSPLDCSAELRARNFVPQLAATSQQVCLVPTGNSTFPPAAQLMYWLEREGNRVVVPKRWGYVFGEYRIDPACDEEKKFSGLRVVVVGTARKSQRLGFDDSEGAQLHDFGPFKVVVQAGASEIGRDR